MTDELERKTDINSFEAWVARQNARMMAGDCGVVQWVDKPGEVRPSPYYDPKRPQGKFGPLAMRPEMYRPGMVMDPIGVPDLLNRLKGE